MCSAVPSATAVLHAPRNSPNVVSRIGQVARGSRQHQLRGGLVSHQKHVRRMCCIRQFTTVPRRHNRNIIIHNKTYTALRFVWCNNADMRDIALSLDMQNHPESHTTTCTSVRVVWCNNPDMRNIVVGLGLKTQGITHNHIYLYKIWMASCARFEYANPEGS